MTTDWQFIWAESVSSEEPSDTDEQWVQYDGPVENVPDDRPVIRTDRLRDWGRRVMSPTNGVDWVAVPGPVNYHYSAPIHDHLRGILPDSYTEMFELEKTERCWRDECFEVSSDESETGLCTSHLSELKGRWKK